MKILHLSSEKTWRGGEQQMAYLITELQKSGVENYVACRKNSEFEKFCERSNIPFASFSFSNSFDLPTSWKIKNYSNRNSIDIIHMNSGKSHAIGVFTSFFGARADLVLSRRVDFPIKSGWFSKWKYNYPKIKKIIGVSEKICEIVGSSVQHPEKCMAIHSGIDITRMSPEYATGFLRKKYNLPTHIKLVGNVSAIAPHKDYFTFVKTAERILKQRDDVIFFIIGEGPVEKVIKDFVLNKKLKDKIIFTGFLDNIPEVLPELDIFLITSETEGLGTTVLDAFASHVPVVATRAGGIPEMVIHEKTGLLSDVKDDSHLAANVLRLLDDPTLRKQLQDGAYDHLQNFTKENTARKTLEVYKEILTSN